MLLCASDLCCVDSLPSRTAAAADGIDIPIEEILMSARTHSPTASPKTASPDDVDLRFGVRAVSGLDSGLKKLDYSKIGCNGLDAAAFRSIDVTASQRGPTLLTAR